MSKRSYHQFCGVAKALDVIGERWTLLLIRDLLLGPRRYSDLLNGLPGITTNLLADRLRRLSDNDVVVQETLPPPAASVVYRLTDRGERLRPAVLALGAFGASFMESPNPDDHLNPRWAMVSLMRRYAGASRSWTLQLEIDDLTFCAAMAPECMRVSDGPASAPDVTIRGDRLAWVAFLFRGVPGSELLAKGRLERSGSARAFRDFGRSIGAVA